MLLSWRLGYLFFFFFASFLEAVGAGSSRCLVSFPGVMMSLSSDPAKLQLDAGWTPPMSGKGGAVLEGEEGGGKWSVADGIE